MKEYHKIETLFERDLLGNKKLIEGKFRNKTVEFLKDCKWDFTEKIDGTNIRIYWNGHNVIFGGRTENAQIPSFLINHLNEKFLGIENEEMFEQIFGEKEVILYGEGYGAKIQKGGGNYRKDNGFILFDVLINNVFLDREDVANIAKSFNIPIVPIVFSGTIDDAVNYVKTKPKSTISEVEHISEGVVGRPSIEMKDKYGERIIVKIKHSDFL